MLTISEVLAFLWYKVQILTQVVVLSPIKAIDIVLHNIDARALHESFSPLLVERTKYLVERDSC